MNEFLLRNNRGHEGNMMSEKTARFKKNHSENNKNDRGHKGSKNDKNNNRTKEMETLYFLTKIKSKQ